MARVRTLIDRIAPSDSSVLILGETGTGKELAARRIHEASRRSTMPFVAVNCGALPEQLVESELFGHRKGAFTGADSHRKGLIEVAHGGTLFLDELGELDRNVQVKLLRFLESGEVRRIGENESFHVDVRVVCATNRPLQDMVTEGSFREDLFFRVNTFEIRLPALRDHVEDLPALVEHLIRRLHRKRGTAPARPTRDALDLLKAHAWNGNVRELANAVEYALTLCDGRHLTAADLPESVQRAAAVTAARRAGHEPAAIGSLTAIPVAANANAEIWTVSQPRTLRDIEMDVIYRVLDKHHGDKPRAASELGIALKTLYNKLNQYEVRAHAG